MYTVMVSGYVHHSRGSSLRKWQVTLPRHISTFNIQPARVAAVDVHRASFNSKLVGNGATLHRLVLASLGKGLASYNRLKRLSQAAGAIVVGIKLASFFGGLISDTSPSA